MGGEEVSFVRFRNGKWVVCSRTTGRRGRRFKGRCPANVEKDFKDWHLAKNDISLNKVIFPKKLWGKRIRFVIEEVAENRNG